MFSKKTIKDIDLAGKTILVRVDYNVLAADGSVGESLRLEATAPTLDYLFKNDCKVILMSHAGRPEGKPDPKLSLKPVADKLSEIISRQVHFVGDCVGPEVEAAVKVLKPGEPLLLENLRFHPEEEANDPEFAKKLASLADVFVQDCFGVAHRAHASIEAITKLLPAVSGLLLEKEVSSIKEAIENPAQPLLVIMGGAKVSDKIELLDRLLGVAKQIVIAGAMANTFFKEMGYNIGQSLYETDALDQAKQIRNDAKSRGVELYLPTADVAVANNKEPTAERIEKSLEDVKDDEYILDVGPKVLNDIEGLIRQAGSLIWNGPVGMTELPNFIKGSVGIAETAKQAGIPSLAGGGDTTAFLEKQNLLDRFSFVSTGGGSTLELMAGKTLPGVEALLDK